MKTFKVLGLLLTYPSEELIANTQPMAIAVREEALLSAACLAGIDAFFSWQKTTDLFELQEIYVATFDRGRAHCLHLFEHVHGESRDRGQAMVELAQLYWKHGLRIDNRELPDYLPLFLEYLSMRPYPESLALLDDCIDIVAAIGARLKRCESRYHIVFDALERLSKKPASQERIEKMFLAEGGDPQTLDELDEQWREAPAFEDKLKCGDCGGGATKSHNGSALQYKVGIK